MARLWFIIFIVSCSLLQNVRAEPRPDFGAKETVTSSGTVALFADITKAGLLTADDKNGLKLLTNYTLFSNVLPLIESLGIKVASLGAPVASAISAAASDDSRNVNGVFNAIYNATTPYKAFLTTQVNSTKSQLIRLVGSDINHLFGDAFPNMYAAIVKVETNLKKLQADVLSAGKRGNQLLVSPLNVSAVQSAIMDWSATIEAVRSTIYTSIDNIKGADAFLNRLYNISRTLNGDLDVYYRRFTANQTAFGGQLQLLVNAMKFRVQITHTPSLQYIPKNTAALSGTISQFNTTYTKLTGIPAMLASDVFPGYFNTSYSIIPEIKQLLNPLDYGSVTSIIEVLVASGPYSINCFNKYFPLIENAFELLAYDVDVCYNIEVERAFNIADIFSDMLDQTMYDLDDFYLNIPTCEWTPTPGICQTAVFGTYYSSLTTAYAAKVAEIEKFLKTEATASAKRLGSCMQTKKAKNKATLLNMATEIASCRKNGVNGNN